MPGTPSAKTRFALIPGHDEKEAVVMRRKMNMVEFTKSVEFTQRRTLPLRFMRD
jgi:hypothetical protein